MYLEIAITSNGQADQLEVILQEALLCRRLPCGSHFSTWVIVNVAEDEHRSTAAWQDADSGDRKRREGTGERRKDGQKKPKREPNRGCWGPAVYTISDRKGNVGGREGENEQLEKGVQWGKERNSFWGDIWLWLGGAVWTSQPLPLVLTGLFRGRWCCFWYSKWLINRWLWATHGHNQWQSLMLVFIFCAVHLGNVWQLWRLQCTCKIHISSWNYNAFFSDGFVILCSVRTWAMFISNSSCRLLKSQNHLQVDACRMKSISWKRWHLKIEQ